MSNVGQQCRNCFGRGVKGCSCVSGPRLDGPIPPPGCTCEARLTSFPSAHATDCPLGMPSFPTEEKKSQLAKAALAPFLYIIPCPECGTDVRYLASPPARMHCQMCGALAVVLVPKGAPENRTLFLRQPTEEEIAAVIRWRWPDEVLGRTYSADSPSALHFREKALEAWGFFQSMILNNSKLP